MHLTYQILDQKLHLAEVKMYERVALIIFSPGRGPWCPSSRELEATWWSTLKCSKLFHGQMISTALPWWDLYLQMGRCTLASKVLTSWKLWPIGGRGVPTDVEGCQAGEEEKEEKGGDELMLSTSSQPHWTKPADTGFRASKTGIARQAVVVIFWLQLDNIAKLDIFGFFFSEIVKK